MVCAMFRRLSATGLALACLLGACGGASTSSSGSGNSQQSSSSSKSSAPIVVSGTGAASDLAFSVPATGQYTATFTVTVSGEPFGGELRIYSGPSAPNTSENLLPNKLVITSLNSQPPGTPVTGTTTVQLTAGTWEAGLYGFQDVGATQGSITWRISLTAIP